MIELRTLLVDIYLPTLQRSGLRAAMDDLVAPLRAAGIEVALQVPESLEVPDYIEALVYRVAQEALRNARAHGHPSSVEVGVEADPHRVVLRVVDDGRGFDSAELECGARPRHFGLRLMRDLADHARGVLVVESRPGDGTAVLLEVPLS